MLPDDDWQGEVFKKVKDQYKERKKFTNPAAKIVGNIEKVLTLKMNPIEEKTEEADSLENEGPIEQREDSNQIGAKELVKNQKQESDRS